MKLYFDTFGTPLGDMTVASMKDGAICLLDFSDCQKRSDILLNRRFGAFDREIRTDPQDIQARLSNYFDGRRASAAFDGLALDTGGTAFQKRVWNALGDIPFGATLSYTALAAKAGSPRAVRAVGSANGRNPVAIVIPCHRVIAKDGSLAGYAGGVSRKQKLLALERGC